MKIFVFDRNHFAYLSAFELNENVNATEETTPRKKDEGEVAFPF